MIIRWLSSKIDYIVESDVETVLTNHTFDVRPLYPLNTSLFVSEYRLGHFFLTFLQPTETVDLLLIEPHNMSGPRIVSDDFANIGWKNVYVTGLIISSQKAVTIVVYQAVTVAVV